MSTRPPARTYNQAHRVRPHTGGRRISIYWTWSYPWESQRDIQTLDNRFSTITEVRRAAWPRYEGPDWDDAHFLQGIAGTWSFSTARRLRSRSWPAKQPVSRWRCSSASTRPATGW